MTVQYVYRFGGGISDGGARDKDLLGGKGANLAEMSLIGLPVPPGFTIGTPMCARYYEHGERIPDDLRDQCATGIAHIEHVTGKNFGDPADPLLVSVRSGARVSMPGMMDTVLNLGLNDETVAGLAEISGDPRFAWDSYRRFIQMYADVVLGLDHGLFEEALEIAKEDKDYRLDTEMEAADWQALVAEYRSIAERELGRPFPLDPNEQLWGAIGAVFGSWQAERAKIYRRLNDIPGDWGTAVNVQAMVFGNMGETSATGVAFTRDPSTGDKAYYGEWLINAQGEDVVAGIRTPQYLTRAARENAGATPSSMEEAMPETFVELAQVFDLLENHYRDMQDIEFTVERGKLWMLQTRSGKRTAKAALKIAVDMASEGLIGEDEAVRRVDPAALDQLLHPTLDPEATRDVVAKGLPASPGAASGMVVFDADAAERRAEQGQAVILVRVETSPEDIHGMHAARGHPHRARRHDEPRCRRRARHGPALRFGRRQHRDRCEGQAVPRRRPRDSRGRHDHHRRQHRRSDGRRGRDRPARACRRLRPAHDMGRPGTPYEGARQRRNPGRLPHRARIRRRGHRLVPPPSICSSTRIGSPLCAR